jgi:N-acetylglucosaminyldiphosphoundecaprenol N-acetyl-beta-D-mannosaminyltransferase
MEKYFDLNFEFDHDVVDQIIFEHIKGEKPGYVCSMDCNNLAISKYNSDHKNVLNGAIVNNCDSSWIPVFINKIHKKKYKNYCGTDLFIKYIKMKRFQFYFLGSTPLVLSRLQDNLSKIDPRINEMRFETLPFQKVEEFDYEQIASMINLEKPDIIWVSLGAPKQEKFMSLLKPHLKKGVMFGFGAIFNVYAEMPGLKRAPAFMVKLKLEWLFRLLQEPRKQFQRNTNIISILPRLIREELKQRKDPKINTTPAI